MTAHDRALEAIALAGKATLPAQPAPDVVDRVAADPECGGKSDGADPSTGAANAEHFAGGQLRCGVCLAVVADDHRAPLGVAIPAVVEVGSKEQVRRVDARAHVAPMENEKAIGYAPVVYHPRDAVRLAGGCVLPQEEELPVASTVEARGPEPAAAPLGNLGPESFHRGVGGDERVDVVVGSHSKSSIPVVCQFYHEYATVSAALLASEAREKRLREFVGAQALDDGLWFVAETAPEAYLQQELRRLHALIENGAEIDAALRESEKT